ncbi:unnamed protein product [Mytilus coruscus]|uniref:Secreted protein n=1 Tax=Mytilus coruscus TaxID=42192 RepID=A0A6J8EPE4_MYTCO|nr:unnamed protein product [Mytilus coruscus]
MIAMFLFVVVSLLSISHVGSVANTAECYRSEEILDCRGGGIQYFSGEIDPSISRVLMNHIMKSEQIQNVRVKATCVFELTMSNKELCDTVEGKIIWLTGKNAYRSRSRQYLNRIERTVQMVHKFVSASKENIQARISPSNVVGIADRLSTTFESNRRLGTSKEVKREAYRRVGDKDNLFSRSYHQSEKP